MTRGRPPLGPDIVQHGDADPNTKRRLHVLLQTLAGDLSVPDACHLLAISQARFFELRSTMLQAALQSLQPKPAGRPAKPIDPESDCIQQLQQQNRDLRVHLAAAQLREEIALAMPHLSSRHKDNSKKKSSKPAANPARSFQITQTNNRNSESSAPGSSDT